MSGKLPFSAIEAPTHPKLTRLYAQHGIKEQAFSSMRKLLGQLKKTRPDYVAAEFFYGYGNNYAGVNICNLDVFLYSLQKYSRETRIIVMVERREQQFVDRLAALFPLHAVLPLPVSEQDLEQALAS